MSEARPPPPELEKLPTAWLLRVGAVALALLAAASVAAWALWVLWRPGTESPLPPPPGTQQIGMLDQPPFSLDRRADELKARQRERLDGYGWVDADAGVIHQPIDAAMRQLLSEGEGGAR
ncbi:MULTISPECIES: hypothetical protein [unclassified Corallococcus]|uniref:hypothetical protein n=1 Tax=unclassified Corallococcus TaxID=2685029 RepID=UPI001A8C1D93|nr:MULTISPECIES: hypothetical protein [unclassified Corallococcus]MBN9681500.1 hypothetical protein [Corallococcus sp. NCSPR001]WAS86924.1 hypothetical protein O0N60_08085 [Corallococcus sp. NCRR]